MHVARTVLVTHGPLSRAGVPRLVLAALPFDTGMSAGRYISLWAWGSSPFASSHAALKRDELRSHLTARPESPDFPSHPAFKAPTTLRPHVKAQQTSPVPPPPHHLLPPARGHPPSAARAHPSHAAPPTSHPSCYHIAHVWARPSAPAQSCELTHTHTLSCSHAVLAPDLETHLHPHCFLMLPPTPEACRRRLRSTA